MTVSFSFFEPAVVPWLNFSGDAPFNYVLLFNDFVVSWICRCPNDTTFPAGFLYNDIYSLESSCRRIRIIRKLSAALKLHDL
ncbi:MAG: hypothetical protein ABIN67_23645 [Ferruginibacter sp.]